VRQERRTVISLFAFIVAVACAAAFGGLFMPGPWYESLEKPPLTPPNWVFGPVWTLLYISIAVAAWLVWRSGHRSKPALTLWALQLVLNALWSLLFFGIERPDLALIDITVLLVILVATTVAFFRTNRLAGALLLPYVAWVAFAAYLNAGFLYLNG
jgi:tryptophan-rich sensory protein